LDLEGEQKCINKINPLQWNDFEYTSLPILIPCLEFNIEIESNSLMYNPNKAIRDRVFPLKIGKFSIKYYTSNYIYINQTKLYSFIGD